MMPRKRIGQKGQMFLIGAIVIVASLVIIKFNMASPAAMKEKESLEAQFESDVFENIADELNSTIDFSYDNPQNITRNVFDFANFTEAKLAEHSLSFKFLYVGIIANKTISRMNVSLVNMLDGTIDANFTISGVGSNTKRGIVDYERWDTNFTISPGTQYELVLTYNSTAGDTSSTSAYIITVKTKKNKDVYASFFYVLLQSQEATHAAKYQKTVNIH
jgi:hypothetical protein